jgi:hypothetical protein
MSSSDQFKEHLARVLDVIQFYEGKVQKTGARSAKDAMRTVAREIEQEGLHGVKDSESEVTFPLK